MKRGKKRSPLRVILRILGGVLAALALVFVTMMYLIPATERADAAAVAGSADWMAALDDGLPLGEVVLPGTHDSAAQYVQLAYFSKCQSKDVGAQLEAGCRYLDIRLGVESDSGGGQMKLMHGFTSCRTGGAPWSDTLYLDSVLGQCYAFLDAHPTETVVFAVKQEHGDEPVRLFESLVDAHVSARPDRWLLTDRVPTVGEARGRLVLMRRYGDEAGLGARGGVPLLWTDQGGHDDVSLHTAASDNGGCTLWVQDRYKYGADDKWAAFTAGMAAGETGADAVSINFLSTNGTAAYGHPYRYAKELNARLMELPVSAERGWIVVDFASAPLAEHIYRANFE